MLELVDNMSFDHDPEIVCDASELRFVDPAGLCLLACASQDATDRGQTVNIEGLADSLNTYLQRMDVFEGCNVTGLRPVVAVRHDHGVLVEVDRVHSRGDIESTAARLARTMLGDDTGPESGDGMAAAPGDYQRVALNYVLTELLENGLTHARKHGFQTADAWVSCQYYPRLGAIRAAVVDNGCGFLRSLRPEHGLGATDHRQAIDLALQPRVSANRAVGVRGAEANNLGLGLTISKDIINSAGGHLHIGSGDRLLTVSEWGSDARPITEWQGAVLALEVPRAALRDVRIATIVGRYDDRPAQNVRFID